MKRIDWRKEDEEEEDMKEEDLGMIILILLM